MPSHTHHEVFLHLVWRTYGDRPLLRSEVRERVHGHIRRGCAKTRGVFFHAVGGTEDHVHVVINVEPRIRISDVVKTLKGASSYDIPEISWQRGYGVVSFSADQLGYVVRYVENQMERHRKGRLTETLEKSHAPPPG